MRIQEIDEDTFEKFVKDHEYANMYQSIEWMHVKMDEGKNCEIIGFYENDNLVGASIIIYSRVLKQFKFAYASRGIIYNYKKIDEFTKALKDYFKKQDVVFLRIDPPVILATYDAKLNKTETNNEEIIEELKRNGFKHFGFNMAAEAFQFRFVHRITLEENYEKTVSLMSKSTRKNITLAEEKGVKIKSVTAEDLDEVLRIFQYTIDRKEIVGFPKTFYQNLVSEFKDKVRMYIVYIDKKTYIENLKKKIQELEKNLIDVEEMMKKSHVGVKLTTKKEHAVVSIKKHQNELVEAEKLDDITNIASMLTITKYKEVVSLTSGMNNDYRAFCPKYVMYPEMIKDAYKDNLKYVNFLGVKNIFDEHDKDHGVYEVKRGFGGNTIEYIGEFDLPMKPLLYKIYSLLRKTK